jgi:hypothetical protein
MRRLLVLVMLAVFVGSGCGTTADPGAGPPVVPGSAGTSGGGATGSGAVPDACALITSAQLAQILGSDPGPGQTGGADPRRSICIYQSGTITAVEVAANYAASRRIIEDMGRKTTDVPGVGTAAFYDEAGQLVASGRTVFVAVTAAGVSQDKLVEVCRAMLVAAGEA